MGNNVVIIENFYLPFTTNINVAIVAATDSLNSRTDQFAVHSNSSLSSTVPQMQMSECDQLLPIDEILLCTQPMSYPIASLDNDTLLGGQNTACKKVKLLNNEEKPYSVISDESTLNSDSLIGPYCCHIAGCGKMFVSQANLKTHMRIHSGERPFVCSFVNTDGEPCNKSFHRQFSLKQHIRTHTDERPYVCPYLQTDGQMEVGVIEGEERVILGGVICGKAFRTSSDLTKHTRIHTGVRPFKCTYPDCGLSFTTSNILKVHLRTHSGEKPYQCPVVGCRKSFNSASHLSSHTRIHTGEKPYICSFEGCGKTFTEYSTLYKHQVVHTRERPYPCLLCGKLYRQTSTLAMHLRMAHSDHDVTNENGSADCSDNESDEQNDSAAIQAVNIDYPAIQAGTINSDCDTSTSNSVSNQAGTVVNTSECVVLSHPNPTATYTNHIVTNSNHTISGGNAVATTAQILVLSPDQLQLLMGNQVTNDSDQTQPCYIQALVSGDGGELTSHQVLLLSGTLSASNDGSNSHVVLQQPQ